MRLHGQKSKCANGRDDIDKYSGWCSTAIPKQAVTCKQLNAAEMGAGVSRDCGGWGAAQREGQPEASSCLSSVHRSLPQRAHCAAQGTRGLMSSVPCASDSAAFHLCSLSPSWAQSAGLHNGMVNAPAPGLRRTVGLGDLKLLYLHMVASGQTRSLGLSEDSLGGRVWQGAGLWGHPHWGQSGASGPSRLPGAESKGLSTRREQALARTSTASCKCCFDDLNVNKPKTYGPHFSRRAQKLSGGRESSVASPMLIFARLQRR